MRKKRLIFILLIFAGWIYGNPYNEANDLTGKINASKDKRFVEIKSGLFLRKEAFSAFLLMAQAAKKEGITLNILSATRNYSAQKGIWEEKWSGKRHVNGQNLAKKISDPVQRAQMILKYSSMPGTSRHHWGTDMDLNSLDPVFFESGAGKKIYQWLKRNAGKYGFCQPYTEFGASRQNGYQEEKWHWSYKPLSSEMLKKYLELVKYQDIQGFQGAETAETLKVIENYVDGINPECR